MILFHQVNYSSFFVGKYAKYDSIVSPSAESWNLLKSFFRYLTREVANKADIEEFKLCLRAFLPKLTFSFNPADAVIDSCITVVRELYRMCFVTSGNSFTRFDSFSGHEKLEVNRKLPIFLYFLLICLKPKL